MVDFLPIQEIKKYLLDLQRDVCYQLRGIDPKIELHIDPWNREAGGGGNSQILKNGAIFESAGINFSHVFGTQLPQAASHSRPLLQNSAFQALGVSIVIHPRNPYIPTTHANVRLFTAQTQEGENIWWFGGGFDLTPYYPFEEDCIHWHQSAFKACHAFGDDVYPRFKSWCDRYFYLKHRDEQRGIGGLFFDDLNEWPFETCFAFMRSVGNSFMEAYAPIVEKRKDLPFSEKEIAFQLYRRGRYVEFNLLYDRGTLFGLQSGGRTESILMSLPPSVRFEYDWQPEAGSPEAKLYEYLKPRDWLESYQRLSEPSLLLN